MIGNKIYIVRFWLLIGFLSAFSAYSFSALLWNYSFYHLIAFSFFCYTRVIFLLINNSTVLKDAFTGYWKIPVLVIHLTTVNALYDEVLGDPLKIGCNEYLSVILMIIIVIYKRYKESIISFYKKLKNKWM